MDRRLRNRALLLLVLLGAVAYGLIRLSGRQPVAKIIAVTVKRETLVASILSNGKVEPIAPAVIRAELATFVDKVAAVEGQAVKRGQLLLELDVKDVTAQLAQARSNLLRAEDDLRAARAGGRSDEAARVRGDLAKAIAERDRLQRNHDALQRLLQQQAATTEELAQNVQSLARAQDDVTHLTAAKQEFDRQVSLDAARAALQVDQEKSNVAALEEKVRMGSITAPIDGTLYSFPVKAGDFVKVGDLLAQMADLRKVRVRAFIDEPELGALEANAPVIITWDALPDRTWLGTTEILPKQVVPLGTRSVGELLCAVNNDKLELLPNININVRINARQRTNALAVQRGAVEITAGHRYVYVVKDAGLNRQILEKRELLVGIASPTSYEVTSGLSEGEEVALPGEVDLKDGMRVRVVSTED